jgi:hypothetical protein
MLKVQGGCFKNGRANCHPCGSGNIRSNCKQTSILYESKCKLCNPEKPAHPSTLQEEPGLRAPGHTSSRMEERRLGIYYGESSRSLYERSKEHVNDAETFKEGSHIVKHWMAYHQEDNTRPEFIFTVLSTFKDCLSRQVAEAIKIHYSVDDLLNSKNEYNANHLSRVVVEENAFEKKKKAKEEELKELAEKKEWETFRLAHKTCPKRLRGKDTTIPNGWIKAKRLKRMETEEETIDLTDWWNRVEQIQGWNTKEET